VAATKAIDIRTEIPGPRSRELLAREELSVASPLRVHLPIFAAHAESATITDVDGNRFVDFAGGVGVQNVGYGHPRIIEAAQEQVALFIHTDFTVVPYEGYIELAERLGALAPFVGPTRAAFFNSGAEAVENAVKFARLYTGRLAVIAFEGAFHGRTLLAMTMTSKVVPYKRGFGPFAPEVYRTPAPYPFRGVSEDDAIAELRRLFKADVDPESVACAVLEPVQGEGGFIQMTPDFPRRLQELLDEHGILYVDDEVQAGCGRTGPAWAIEHYGVEPDLLVAGKSLGGGMPLASVTGRAEVVDAVGPGGLGGTFGGNPVACAAANVVLEALPGVRPRAEAIGVRLREALERMAPPGSDVRGLGPMVALELPDQSPDRAATILREARGQGLLLLSCGLYGNVIRILVPFAITDEQLDRGLGILERVLGG
jgi:4-aminobutyrate aminotransferase/(S)-3-amino-2-methylpropionate transaminase